MIRSNMSVHSSLQSDAKSIQTGLLSPSLRWPIIALLFILLIVGIHVVLIWGYTALPGDAGRWRHEVERFANGEILYRDFVWAFPPVALWLLGSVARIFGSSTTVIASACTFVTFFLATAYWAYCCRLLKGRSAVAIVGPVGILAAIAYAQIASDALPLGMYTPAAPIGFLFLLISICGWLSSTGVLVGVCCALAIATKQDFWLPAAVILLTFFLKNRPQAKVACFCATGVLVGIAAVIVPESGWSALPSIITGYGRISLDHARFLPSWERVSAEAAALAMIMSVALLGLRRLQAAILAFGLFVVLAAVIFVHSPNFGVFRKTLLLHQLPIFLPAVFLYWAVRSRRTDLICLLSIALAARVRRGFEHTEWFSFLIELPIYALILDDRKGRRSIPALATAMVTIAAAAYWQLGNGPLTHQAHGRQWVQTAKGPVNFSNNDAHLYYHLRSMIGSAQSPLFVFYYTGGFNYYLDRPNPSRSDQGIIFSGQDPRQVIDHIRATHPMLLEPGYYDHVRIPGGISVVTWQIRMVDSYVNTKERPLFGLLATGCERSMIKEDAQYWFYRCP